MFYAIGSAKIPISKRGKTMEVLKKLRDHLNSTYDDVEMEIVSSMTVGEEILTIEKFESKEAWVKHYPKREGDEEIGNFFKGMMELYDRIDSHHFFYETVD